jgi:hypothetical protein
MQLMYSLFVCGRESAFDIILPWPMRRCLYWGVLWINSVVLDWSIAQLILLFLNLIDHIMFNLVVQHDSRTEIIVRTMQWEQGTSSSTQNHLAFCCCVYWVSFRLPMNKCGLLDISYYFSGDEIGHRNYHQDRWLFFQRGQMPLDLTVTYPLYMSWLNYHIIGA